MGRRGFTIIELIVSIALASIVTGGIASVFTLLRAVDRTTAVAADAAVDRARAHATLQAAFGTLIAATPLNAQTGEPLEEGEGEGDAADGEGDDANRADDLALPPEVMNQVGALFSGDAAAGLDDKLAVTVAVADTSQPPFFELFYERVTVSGSQAVALPRLAVTMTRLPIDARTDEVQFAAAKWRGISRGVFELLYEPDRDAWSLAFSATDPPAPPVRLLGGITFLEFTALEPDEEQTDLQARQTVSEWRTLYAAYLKQDFPDAVRLRMELDSGESVDWMFETTVLTEGGR